MVFSLVAASRGYSLVAVIGLLMALTSLVVECRLLGAWVSVVAACGLRSCSSCALEHRLSCSVAFGIFADQGSNPCLLNWQADALPLRKS